MMNNKTQNAGSCQISRQPSSRLTYADIIDLPHHEPDPIRHPRMSLTKRAAQFAPFAALRGYDDLISEETRVTDVDHMRPLEPDEAELLNQRIRKIIELAEAGQHPAVARHPIIWRLPHKSLFVHTRHHLKKTKHRGKMPAPCFLWIYRRVKIELKNPNL